MDYISALLEGRRRADLCGGWVPLKASSPAGSSTGLTGNWGVFQKLGEAMDRELICLLWGTGGKAAHTLMSLGCRVCRGFLWCQGEHLPAPLNPLQPGSILACCQGPNTIIWVGVFGGICSRYSVGFGSVCLPGPGCLGPLVPYGVTVLTRILLGAG